MKILFVIPILGGGGAEVLIGMIAEELHRSGHQIKIVCLKDHHYTYENFPNKEFMDTVVQPVRINCSVTFRLFRPTTVENADFVRFVDDYKPDVIHSHLYESELIAHSYIKPEIKYFSHGHDNMIQLKRLSLKTFFSKREFTNYYERHWLIARYKRANSTFIAISKDTFAYFSQNLPSPIRERTVLLYNAINLKRFGSGEKNGVFTLVSTGNLVPKKGHALLLDTMSVLLKRGLKVQLYILGYGPQMQELQDQSKQLSIEDFVHFEGNVANVQDYLKRAHIYVHSAKYEPFGLAIIEAMASELPVVCTDGVGNRDLIQEGKNGFMITNRDADAFADKIDLLLRDEKLRQEIGLGAKEFSKQFDISKYVERLLEIYRSSNS